MVMKRNAHFVYAPVRSFLRAWRRRSDDPIPCGQTALVDSHNL